jgi:hypothetical protein
MGRGGSCARNGKWITSCAAIVAPQTCDCGQGRVRCANTGASRYFTSFDFFYLADFLDPNSDLSYIF